MSGIIVSVQRFVLSFSIRGISSAASVFGILAAEVCQGDKTIILFLITQKAEFSELVVCYPSAYSHGRKGINSFVILLHEILRQQDNALFMVLTTM